MVDLWTASDFDSLLNDLRAPAFWDSEMTFTYGLLKRIIEEVERKGKNPPRGYVCNAVKIRKPNANVEGIPTYADLKRNLQIHSTDLELEVEWISGRCRHSLGPYCEDRQISIYVDTHTTQEYLVAPRGFGIVVNGVILELRQYWCNKQYQWKVLCRWLEQLEVLEPVWSEQGVRKKVTDLHKKHQSLKRKPKAKKELERQPFGNQSFLSLPSPEQVSRPDITTENRAEPFHQIKNVIIETSHNIPSVQSHVENQMGHKHIATEGQITRSKWEIRQNKKRIRQMKKNSKRREARRDEKLQIKTSLIDSLVKKVDTQALRQTKALLSHRCVLRQRQHLRSQLRQNQITITKLKSEIKLLSLHLHEKQDEIHRLEDELKEMRNDQFTINTKDERRYSDDMRQTVMCLGSAGISAKNIVKAIDTVSSGLFHAKLSELPSETTVKTLLSEANLVSKLQVGSTMMSSENSTFHADGTTDHQRHFFGFQIATGNQTFSMGIRETVDSDAKTQLEELTETAAEFASLLTSDPTEQEDINTQLLFAIKNLMTDQHVVNRKFKDDFEQLRMTLLHRSEDLWNALTPDERRETVRLHQWFCFLHVLLGFADATESALNTYEDILTSGGSVPIGRAKTNADSRRDLSAVCESVKAVCSLLTPSGHPAAGIPEDFRAWMTDRNISIHFVKFAHNRFNVLFQNASALFYHHGHITQFLTESKHSNQLIEAVRGDLQDPILLACVRGVAIFHLLVTSPFHVLVLETKHIVSLNPYLQQLRTALEEMSSNPWCILQRDYSIFSDRTPPKTDIYRCVIPQSDDEENLDITLEVFSLIATHSLVMFARQVSSQLPGGEHFNIVPSQKVESSSVATSNSIGESHFAFLKYLRQIKPNACVPTLEASVMWAYNKTNTWLKELDPTERHRILQAARTKCQEFKDMWRTRQVNLRKQRLAAMKRRERSAEEKAAKETTGRQRTIDEVEGLGGQCRTPEDVDKLIEQLTGKELVAALKSQLRFYKNIVSPPGTDKSLFNFSRLGRAFTSQQLATNLKKIIVHYCNYIQSTPGVSHQPTIAEPAVREVKILAAKQSVLCNYSTMSEDKPTSGLKKGLKRKVAFPINIVGKRIRHRWVVGKSKRWYIGTVLSVSDSNQLPTEDDDRDDNAATSSVYTLYNVSYDGDDDQYRLRLEKDWYRGDVEVLEDV